MGAGASTGIKISDSAVGAAEAKFNELDVNGKGCLGDKKEELDAIVASLLVNCPTDDKDRLQKTVANRLNREFNGKCTVTTYVQLTSDVAVMIQLIDKAAAKFKELDADNSGFLEVGELGDLAKFVLQETGSCKVSGGEGGGATTPSHKEAVLAEMLKALDQNGDGKLDLAEFSTLFYDVYNRQKLISQARTKFLELDANNSGSIDGAELDTLVSWMVHINGDQALDEAALTTYKEKLMRRIDINNDGQLELAEFIELFREINVKLEINRIAAEKFAELDTNHSGTLEHDELVELVTWLLSIYGRSDETMKPDMVASMRKTLMERIDSNKDGVLDQAEFNVLIAEVTARVQAMDKAEQKFRSLDSNGSGVLEAAEIDEVVNYCMTTLYLDGAAPLCDKDQAAFKDTLMKRLDANGDGKLTLEEFSKLFDSSLSSVVDVVQPHALAAVV